MARSKIAAVCYLNTVPFVYGINHADNFDAELFLMPPNKCAEAFADGSADVALIPVGALPTITGEYKIITTFCIGAERSVRTVVVVSDTPVNRITDLWLDSHSRTSALLAQVLCRELWGVAPEIHTLEDYTMLDRAKEGEAFLLIGDKVFANEGKFRYAYDLADEWRRLTGLPFVFAVWVAREEVEQSIVDDLEAALELGVERIYEAILEHGHADKDYAYEYLSCNIDYLFDSQKRKALELFMEKGRRFIRRGDPG